MRRSSLRQHALFDLRPRFEQMPAINTCQQSALNRRREPAAVFLDKYTADGAFGHLAAQVEEQHVVEPPALGFELVENIRSALRSLVVKRRVGWIGAMQRDADAANAIGIPEA